MAYVVTEPCVGVKDHACVDVCPVDCFYDGGEFLLIHPEECIDCGVCISECPVEAIFKVGEVPDQWKGYIAKNAEPFTAHAELPRASLREKWETLRGETGSAANLYYKKHGKV